MLKINCPNCGVRLTASDDYLGKPVTCQKCETTFVLSKRWMNEPLGSVASTHHQDYIKQGSRARKKAASSSATAMDARSLNPASDGNQPNDPNSDSDSERLQQSKQTKIVQPPSEIAPAATLPASGPTKFEPPSQITPPTISPTFQGPTAIPIGGKQSGSQLLSITRAQQAERRGMPTFDGYVEGRSVWEFFDFRFRRYLTPSILRICWMLVLVAGVIWFFILSYGYVSSLISSGDVALAGIDRAAPSPASSIFTHTPGFILKTGMYLSSIISVLLILLTTRVVFETIILLFSIGNTLRTIDARQLVASDDE